MRLFLTLLTILLTAGPAVSFGRCSTSVDLSNAVSPIDVIQAIADAVDCVVESNDQEIRECHNFSRLVFEKAKSIGSVVSAVKVIWIFAKTNGTLIDVNRIDTGLGHHTVAVIRVANDPADYVVDLTDSKDPISKRSIESWVKSRFLNGGFYTVEEKNVSGLRNRWWIPDEQHGMGAFK